MDLLPDPDPRLKQPLNRPSNPNLDITIRKGYDGLGVVLISLLSRLFKKRDKSMTSSHNQPKRTQTEDIENRFSYHSPKPGQQERYTQITEAFKDLAHLIADLTPESREQSIALTLLWEARMAANGAIAINE